MTSDSRESLRDLGRRARGENARMTEPIARPELDGTASLPAQLESNATPKAASSLAARLRFFGGAVVLFNLWVCGNYNLPGVPLLLMTVGFAIGFEVFVVRTATRKPER